MDLAMGSGGNSGDEHEGSGSNRGKKPYHRHNTDQILQLEAFFKECPHPDENQRRLMSRELSLAPKQIKFWFQNKRTQMKAQNERADNSLLRAENDRIQCENLAIREALKNVICPSCGGPPCGEEERQRSLQKLQLENAQLKEEHEKVASLLAKYIGRPISHQFDPFMPVQVPTPDLLTPSFSMDSIGSPALSFGLSPGLPENISLPNQIKTLSDMEKVLMVETASTALDELVRLFRINEPLWVKSHLDGRYVIHRDSYEKLFPRAIHFRSSSACFESSKESGIITMNPIALVDMILEADKWVDLFPTVVTKANTLQVLENGLLPTRAGRLQLMYEQMHILSPLVPVREFLFLRQCQLLEVGLWVIVDVSYDLKNNIFSSPCWRLPSGFMIQEMPNGCSKITWIEHVEVDDKMQTHRLYRDLMTGGSAYGAERWIVTLQRMCERLAFTMEENPRLHDFGGVIPSAKGRRSTMDLSHRMVKNFCEALSMSGKMDFPQWSELNFSGVRVSVRHSIGSGQPIGIVVSAATSLWLPLGYQDVFALLLDEKRREEWDVLSNGNPVNVISHISTSSNPGNSISIIKPFTPNEKTLVILQECCLDALGGMLVYAPIDMGALSTAIKGDDPTNIQILPSGLIVSRDGRRDHTGSGASSSSRSVGSILTVAFQILVSTPSSVKNLNLECVATVNTLISSTVQRIKVALDCSNID